MEHTAELSQIGHFSLLVWSDVSKLSGENVSKFELYQILSRAQFDVEGIHSLNSVALKIKTEDPEPIIPTTDIPLYEGLLSPVASTIYDLEDGEIREATYWFPTPSFSESIPNGYPAIGNQSTPLPQYPQHEYVYGHIPRAPEYVYSHVPRPPTPYPDERAISMFSEKTPLTPLTSPDPVPAESGSTAIAKVTKRAKKRQQRLGLRKSQRLEGPKVYRHRGEAYNLRKIQIPCAGKRVCIKDITERGR